MSEYGRTSPGFWYKLVHMEPALLRGLIMAVFAFLASVGIVASDTLPDALIGVTLALLALIQALWTRGVVVAEDKVVAYVEKPWSGEQLRAGKATPAPGTPEGVVESAVYQKAA